MRFFVERFGVSSLFFFFVVFMEASAVHCNFGRMGLHFLANTCIVFALKLAHFCFKIEFSSKFNCKAGTSGEFLMNTSLNNFFDYCIEIRKKCSPKKLKESNKA